MKPWWEIWPGRLDAEFAALEAAGIRFERNEGAFSKGMLCLRLLVEHNGEKLDLEANYPDNYPYFRFEVAAPQLSLRHHQHLFGKNLCLIGRATDNWRTSETLAQVLQTQLPSVLETGRSEDLAAVAGKEEVQAEPLEAYLPYGEHILMVQSNLIIPAQVMRGFLKIGVAPDLPLPDDKQLRGVVLEVQDDQHNVLVRSAINYLAYASRTMTGRWVRTPNRLPSDNLDKLLHIALALDTGGYSIATNQVQGGHLRIFGILHPDEVARYRELSEAWLFIAQFVTPSKPKPPLVVKGKPKWGRR